MTDSTNPLLKKISLPGRRFRLPSRGLFYTNGELDDDITDGEIEVFSMTTTDEITLRSPEFLYSGEAIERVFRRCIPEVKKPLELMSKDVDFLLACLRVVSYGGTYEVKTRCPKCEEKQTKSNDEKLEEFLSEVRVKSEETGIPEEAALEQENVQNRIQTIVKRRSPEVVYYIDLDGIIKNNTTEITNEESKKYNVTLSNGQNIQLRPFRMDTAVMAHRYQNNDMSRNLDLVEEYITFVLAANVKSVDGCTDRDQISEWAKKLPISLKTELQNATENTLNWGTSFEYTIKCTEPTCGHERNISTLLNPITFFMTPSELEGPSS